MSNATTTLQSLDLDDFSDRISTLICRLDNITTVLGGIMTTQSTMSDRAMPRGEATVAAPAQSNPSFVALSPYTSLPYAAVADDVATRHGSAEDDGYMTVSQLLTLLRKVPDHAIATLGAPISLKVLRVYPKHHRRHAQRTGHYIYPVEAVVSAPDEVTPFFNASQLGAQPAIVENLIEELEAYADTAPDAVVLTPSGLASLDISQITSTSTAVPLLTRRRLDDFLECDLNPFDRQPLGNGSVDDIVQRAKTQAVEQRPLGEIATDLGRAFASGGLAAVDLFYVPAAKTGAAANLARYTGRGNLLTRAEFEHLYGRAIADAHIQAFYRPVTPCNLSQPTSPLARVLTSGCTNVADLCALLDDCDLSCAA
ncbi:hypothetical protein pqer_cds_452 [Pandoravirus quercus]|uniref:DUF5865 domain-containing protein n=2 Tax=Pandoravirus TaxID=2060084 RepID=A0A2U7U8V7_9VIRU|nr:hypothetical protein pqer_cds_452 [Pandoravirus quercus]AVK74874.1 hypothetical protein pqer_cds_452 [Pandoravirus quercus]QBZ81060.1 hypothetical protein pclt_cds_465 [Pandoravirus celtis]